MAAQEILSYIREQLQEGHSEEDIRGILKQHNWPDTEVEDAFRELKSPPKSTHSTSAKKPKSNSLWIRVKGLPKWVKFVAVTFVILPTIIMLLAIALNTINPANQLAQAYDVQRKHDISALENAIQAYNKDHATKPLTLEDNTKKVIGNKPYEVDLCKNLVPTYLADIPTDPEYGDKSYTAGNCTQSGAIYSSSYYITYDALTKVFTISAHSSLGNSITISK